MLQLHRLDREVVGEQGKERTGNQGGHGSSETRGCSVHGRPVVVCVKLWASEPPSAESVGDRSYVVVKTRDDVAELAGVVLDPARKDLVVVLTSRQDQREPSLDVEDVRAIVGPSALIYFMLTGRLSVDLGERMPDRRGPYNGSMRVWLPGAQGHHREHPQVFDPTGEYGPRSLIHLPYGLRNAFLMRDLNPLCHP